jgi:hypothetical protein
MSNFVESFEDANVVSRWILFAASILATIPVIAVVDIFTDLSCLGLLGSWLLSILAYPVVGLIGMLGCEAIRRAAFPRAQDRQQYQRVLVTAAWPVAVIYWTVVGPYFLLLNVLFKR